MHTCACVKTYMCRGQRKVPVILYYSLSTCGRVLLWTWGFRCVPPHTLPKAGSQQSSCLYSYWSFYKYVWDVRLGMWGLRSALQFSRLNSRCSWPLSQYPSILTAFFWFACLRQGLTYPRLASNSQTLCLGIQSAGIPGPSHHSQIITVVCLWVYTCMWVHVCMHE